MIKTQIGSGFRGYGPNCNVINFIHSLAEFSCEGVTIWINDGDWTRTTVKHSLDPNVVFPEGGRHASVIRLQTNKDLFNFPLFVKAYCKVKWNERLVDAYVLRTFPVITDGELNMKRIYMSPNDYLLKQFSDAGILDSDAKPEKLPHISDYLFPIELENIDLVSLQWANPRVLNLVDLLRLEQDLIQKREAYESNFPKNYLNNSSTEYVSWHPNVPFYKEKVPKVDMKREKKSFRFARAVTYAVEQYKGKTDFSLPDIKSPMLSQSYRDIKEELARVRARIRCIVFACESAESNIMGWNKELGSQTIEFQGARISRTTYVTSVRT